MIESEIGFEDEVYQKLLELANDEGMSLDELVNDICRDAVADLTDSLSRDYDDEDDDYGDEEVEF